MKLLQIVLILFVFGIAALVPVLANNIIFSKQAQAATSVNGADSNVQVVNGVQVVKLHAYEYSYSPNSFKVKKGVPVRILFSADQYSGCGRQLIMREFGVNAVVSGSEEVPIEFTPDREGVFDYRCSMNMFRGKMTVMA